MFRHACFLCKLVTILVIIGALNWGLVGVAGYNVVDHLFGVGSVLARIIYTLVGLSGLALLSAFFVKCPMCNKGPEDKP